LMARFGAGLPNGVTVQQLEVLVRTAIFKPANALVGMLLQAAADRIDATYQSKPGQQRKGRQSVQVHGLFGTFKLERDYYYHEGKNQGHYPADAALGLEGSHTPALARLICLEGADDSSYQKAENHLLETGGIQVSARQIQRMVQRVGASAQVWQEREAQPGSNAVPIMYVSGDGTGVPMRKEELVGRAGKQADGGAKTRMAYLGCVFTQHKRDAEGHPVRDYQSTTYVSSLGSIVSGQSKPARDGHLRTSHFEGRIALSAVLTAQERDERTQCEPATFNFDTDGWWLVPTTHRP
jgi:hypothetical protein